MTVATGVEATATATDTLAFTSEGERSLRDLLESANTRLAEYGTKLDEARAAVQTASEEYQRARLEVHRIEVAIAALRGDAVATTAVGAGRMARGRQPGSIMSAVEASFAEQAQWTVVELLAALNGAGYKANRSNVSGALSMLKTEGLVDNPLRGLWERADGWVPLEAPPLDTP